MLQLIAPNQVKVVIEHTFPLAEVAAAHKLIEANKTQGKVVLTM